MEKESWMDWNPRFRDPDDETLEKMRRSMEEYQKTEMRMLFCPVCHRKLTEVQAERQGIVRVICDKCKSSVPLDLRLFRKQRRRRSAVYRRRRKTQER